MCVHGAVGFIVVVHVSTFAFWVPQVQMWLLQWLLLLMLLLLMLRRLPLCAVCLCCCDARTQSCAHCKHNIENIDACRCQGNTQCWARLRINIAIYQRGARHLLD